MGLFSNKFRVSTGAITANTQFGAFGTVARIVNAGLTFMFGYTFGAATFDTGIPQLSAILGGFVYAFILDAAAFGWDAAGKRQGISPEQRAIADGMSAVSMWASTIISGVQLMLTTTLITIGATARESIGMVALVLITGLLAAHFIRLFAYYRLSPESVDSRIDAELRSTLTAMARAAKEEQAIMIAEQVGQYLTDHTERIVALESRREFNNLLISMGHAEEVARPQVRGKDQTSEGPPPAAPVADPKATAAAEVDNATTEDAYIDFEELKGKAKADQAQNLNLAGA